METYSTDDAMRILKVSRSTLWRLVRDGKIRVCKVGKRNVYRQEELERYLEEVTK